MPFKDVERGLNVSEVVVVNAMVCRTERKVITTETQNQDVIATEKTEPETFHVNMSTSRD